MTRRNTLINKLAFSLLIVGVLALVHIVFAPKAFAGYEAGRIIDDGEFLNAKSMSIADIQNFLVSKNSGLKSMNFVLSCYGSGSKERQLYTNAGAQCDTPIPASQIIYYAAQIYGVNPKVILVTMQKEQSLTTAPNPTSWQLNQAMGYGCPTSGSCSGDSAFPWQIDSGTWALRYHFERARHNMSWWTTSTSWTCGTEKHLYKPNLYPDQDVRFYDTNGTHYATVRIQNPATSSMYCYTPHVYNNPQGLYGRAPYGTTGLYYSGSYNFVYFYELWFGSTHGGFVPRISYVSMSGYPTIGVGKTQSVTIRYKNISGYQTFYGAGDSRTTTPLVLANTNPINRNSSFRHSSWQSPNRPAIVFTVYNPDGSLSSDQKAVKPGDEFAFTYTYSIPFETQPKVYSEWVQPVLEGASMWNLGAVGYFNLTVPAPSYRATLVSTSNASGLPGEKAAASVQYKNTGTQPWYDDTSVPSGKHPLHLANTSPINRASIFHDTATWINNNRPSKQFAAVYESNGSTLASNQHIVQPGQIVRFSYSYAIPFGQAYKAYSEPVQPVLEGAPDWNIGGTATVNVTIKRPADYSIRYYRMSPYPSINRGNSQSVWIDYQNTGANAMYDDTSVPSGKHPLHLANTSPINRASIFHDTATWINNNRPSKQFAAVYESNGSTLASNQHIVQPGQIVRFSYSYASKSTTSTGVHTEWVQPVLEGAATWNIGALGYFKISVN